MRFKTGITASLGLILAFAGMCSAKSENPQRPDVWRLEHRPVNARAQSNVSTETVSIDHDGDFQPGRNLVQDLGESTHSWRNIYVGTVMMGGGLVECQTYVPLSSASLTGAGGNITPANGAIGFVLSTRTMSNTGVPSEGPTTYAAVDIIQSSSAARNITVYIASDSVSSTVGLYSTTTLIGSATFYGYDNKGNYVSELIYFSTNNPVSNSTSTISVSNTPVVSVVGVGNVAFMTISSFTARISSMTDAQGLSTASPIMRVGYGNKIGLPGNIYANSDVLKVTQEGGTDVTNQAANPALSINPTYDTITFPAIAGGAAGVGILPGNRSVCVSSRQSN